MIITEAVHASTTTLDSRHFTEEFIRRRKLADKGTIAGGDSGIPPVPALPSLGGGSLGAVGGGGWSDVAKKMPVQPAQESGNFKVVASKKRGGGRK
jgi:PERQ amino acid-rich with GYF domain-containing protein